MDKDLINSSKAIVCKINSIEASFKASDDVLISRTYCAYNAFNQDVLNTPLASNQRNPRLWSAICDNYEGIYTGLDVVDSVRHDIKEAWEMYSKYPDVQNLYGSIKDSNKLLGYLVSETGGAENELKNSYFKESGFTYKRATYKDLKSRMDDIKDSIKNDILKKAVTNG